MPDWYFDKQSLYRTPSQRGSGGLVSPDEAKCGEWKPISYDTEMRYRREGVRFILEVGKAIGLSPQTMASAAVYFHRFYMFRLFQQFPRFVMATTCLFLAGKAEENPKKCRDLIRTVKSLLNEIQFATFELDPREEVMVMERVLLQTIKFDLHVTHPYASVIKYAKCLQGSGSGAEAKLEKLVQMAWTFVNDSLSTTLCLQFEPEIIAIALMYLASKLSKFEVKDWRGRRSDHKFWWDQYVQDLDTDTLEDICHQVLDLYAEPSTLTADLPPTPNDDLPPPGGRFRHDSSRSRSGSQSQSPKCVDSRR